MARIKNQHTYSLINYEGATAVTDLSSVDNYSTVGFRPHNGSNLNQSWIFQQDGDRHEWFIKSSCFGKYLGVDGNPNQGSVVVVVSYPFKWSVIDSDIDNAKGIRFACLSSRMILAHGTNLSLDLWCGRPENYTTIQLWGSWAGHMQIWTLTPKEPLKIITIPTAARDALIKGDLSAAEMLLTQEIGTDTNNHDSYANRSLVMARKHDWDHALDDAIKSVTIQPSLIGYIFKGIALCGKGHVRDARIAFDIAFMYTNKDSETNHFLLLVKAIALFNADQHEEAMLLVQQLAAACPKNDTLGCRVVETYLYIQLGITAMNDAHHDEAIAHFAAATSSSALSSAGAIDSIYEDFVVLFGWDLKDLWQNANQKRCDALRGAGRVEEALESFRYMMNMIDENAKARCFGWSNAFKQKYGALYLADGDAALATNDYDRAIDLYSVVIELDCANEFVFANCSRAKSKKMLWEGALLDAQKVIELNPSSHIGYQLKHTALYGVKRYNEAVEAFETMLAKLGSTRDMQIRELCERYVSPSEADSVIRKSVDVQLDNSPLCLLNTTTGLICDREAQISTFKSSTEYHELLLALTMKHPNIRMECIAEVVAVYFCYVMLSH